MTADHIRPERLPWEIVETLPTSSPELISAWEERLHAATTTNDRVRSLVGCSLTSYWAAPLGLSSLTWQELADERVAMTSEALELAAPHDADMQMTAILGRLYATWGPDHLVDHSELIGHLSEKVDVVRDDELRLRAREWIVLDHFARADLSGTREAIQRFSSEPAAKELALFNRRELLWYATLAMLEGDIDQAVEINQKVVSQTADLAGSSFSFQNVAVTVAIERFLRKGLADMTESIRSIRASSPRVGSNWESALAFALAESEQLDEARAMFEKLAADDFAAIPRDLNWLVTMQLVALVALHLDDRDRCARLLELLTPFAHLDATHGSGYASYGPVGRVVGALATRCDRIDDARAALEHVLHTRSPGPWTSLSRLELARACSVAEPDRAFQLARSSDEELRSFGLDEWAYEARTLWIGLAVQGNGPPIALLEGERWSLRHHTGSASVDAGIGVSHLVELLARPGETIDSVALEGARTSPASTASRSRPLDSTARREYRHRLVEIEGAGLPAGDVESSEYSFLRRELAGDAYVQSSSAEVERARVRVTKALRRTIDRVTAESPGLGVHLTSSITTGSRCNYAPADGKRWLVLREVKD